MSDLDSTTVPQDGQTEKVPPETPTGGETDQGGAPSQSVPANLKDKQPEELVKMYGDLERKIGEQSGELGQLRQFQKEMGLVLQAIYADPKAKELVEGQMRKLSGVEEKVTEKSVETSSNPVAEVRKVQEAQIIREFERDYGLENLDSDKRQQVYEAIGNSLFRMVNPKNERLTQAQAMERIDLNNLRQMLEDAYYLANRSEVVQKASQEAYAKAQQNQAAMIGSIPASGNVASSQSLTEDERKVARNLGISEEEYQKHKLEQPKAQAKIRS